MSRQLTNEQMQLAQMQLQYEVAKLQQKSQEMANFGAVCGGLASNPIQMAGKMIESMELGGDTFMQVDREIEFHYWED